MSKNKKGKEVFDIHRTLPNKHLKPAAAVKAAEAVAEITPEEKREGFSFKRGLASVLILLLLFVLSIALWDGIELSKASKKMFGSGNLFSLLGGDMTSHNGRTNIMLVGYSVDDPGHPGSTLTDSIMLLSVDKDNHTAYALSIPRDLWVNIPGFGHAKINEAYQDGERSRKPATRRVEWACWKK
jgi:anionic cell wall polymer biosynthesis LytR-Cps2A-Psr (LCP) family protein